MSQKPAIARRGLLKFLLFSDARLVALAASLFGLENKYTTQLANTGAHAACGAMCSVYLLLGHLQFNSVTNSGKRAISPGAKGWPTDSHGPPQAAEPTNQPTTGLICIASCRTYTQLLLLLLLLLLQPASSPASFCIAFFSPRKGFASFACSIYSFLYWTSTPTN